MMALHGCGQRAMGNGGGVTLRGARALAWSGALALSLGISGGRAGACHIKPKDQDKSASASAKTPDAPILNPTSLVNAPTTTSILTPTTAPQITATAATPSALVPSPLTNPPVAEQIIPAAPAVSAHSSGAEPTCSCSCPPINPPPISTNPSPPAAQYPGTQPPASTNLTPNTPEPSTIVSALAMISLAVVARRRRRVVA